MKKIIIIFSIVAVASVSIIFLSLFKSEKQEYLTEKVVRGNILQTVSETGTVKTEEKIELGFLNTGIISKINVGTGDLVNEGDVLAELDYESLLINKKEAQANVDSVKHNLNKLIAGATKEDIAISKALVSQAKTAYDAAKNDLKNTKKTQEERSVQTEKTLSDLVSNDASNVTAYEQAIVTAETNLENIKSTNKSSADNAIDDAIITQDDKLVVLNNALDVFDRTVNDDDAEDLISVKNKAYLTNAKIWYNKSLELLVQANESLVSAKTEHSKNTVINALTDAHSAANSTYTALNDLFGALENSVTSANFTTAELDILKANIYSQQTLVSASISALKMAEQNLNNQFLSYDVNIAAAEEGLSQAKASYNDAVIAARNAISTAQVTGEQQIALSQAQLDSALEAWLVAQAQFAKTIAPPSSHDLNLAESEVRRAEAQLNSIDNRIKNSIIKAPISGMVTDILFEIGEQINSGAKMIILLGKNNFEVEVLISESDIAKLKKGDMVELTLDAFGDDVKFEAIVDFVEPAETIVQDVIYYKSTIKFVEDEKLEGVKSGMTANIIITTAKRENALLIPSRAIIDRDKLGKFVRVLKDNELVEKKVSLGLRGDNGRVEVVSGVSEGEEVIIKIIEK